MRAKKKRQGFVFRSNGPFVVDNEAKKSEKRKKKKTRARKITKTFVVGERRKSIAALFPFLFFCSHFRYRLRSMDGKVAKVCVARASHRAPSQQDASSKRRRDDSPVTIQKSIIKRPPLEKKKKKNLDWSPAIAVFLSTPLRFVRALISFAEMASVQSSLCPLLLSNETGNAKLA